MPKHLIPVVGIQPLLRQTAERLAPHVGWDHLMILTNREQAGMVRDLLPEIPPEQVIAEPEGRNTAACVGLGLRWLELRGEGGSLVGFFPSDHVVRNLDLFSQCLERAWGVAETDRLVAFGVTPTGPETGFGYMQADSPLDDGPGPRVFKVRRFHEKPDRATAEEWVASGQFYWNSGMFVARASVLWEEFVRHLPETSQVLVRLGSLLSDEALDGQYSLYASLPSISLDQGVMEQSRRLTVVEATFGWDDVGSWEAASGYWPEGEGGNRVLGADAVLLDCEGCRVRTEGLLVALVGLRDVIVVQTKDAVLICPRHRAQDVRMIVETLEERQAAKYL